MIISSQSDCLNWVCIALNFVHFNYNVFQKILNPPPKKLGTNNVINRYKLQNELIQCHYKYVFQRTITSKDNHNEQFAT